MAKIRRNVWNLPADDQTLLWYGRAVGEMQKRPATDPTSWRFQAAIHDYVVGEDPLAQPGETLPTMAVQTRFWRQCQHGSWFFLPWHRMFLLYFESIVATEVQKLGGPADWALPYWNYSASEQARLLPPAFRTPTLPDGTPNYLYVEARDPECNAGQQFADDGDVALDALTQASFSDSPQSNFGGLKTEFAHYGRTPGFIERVPHGAMHNAVGGQSGWMSSLNTAGLDPIFWLHHANIDRLWDVWVNLDASHTDPTDHQWLNLIQFSFYNASSQIVTRSCVEMVNTSALGYTYEDVSDPLAAPAALLVTKSAVLKAAVAMPAEPTPNPVAPELVGATASSFQVGSVPAHVQVPIPAPIHSAALKRLASAAPAADAAPHNVLLQLENLTAADRTSSYDVYVNVPEGDDATQHPAQLAGRLDMFGVAEASRADQQHPGSGLTYILDITGIYHSLAAQPGWNPANVRVSLVPVRKWAGAPVTVGRVSVFFG